MGRKGDGTVSEKIESFRDLNVYKLTKGVAIEIFNASKTFPSEEKYSLTDQIRRSSRSVCANLAEAWRKRRYEAAFIAKLNDCEAECSETQVWLEFAMEFGYLRKDVFEKLDDACDRVSRMLVKMSCSAEKWIYVVKEDCAEYAEE
jgi:four helix bundle protein